MFDLKPFVVTRFIGSSKLFDKNKMTITTSVFDKGSNRLNGEISVYNIDDELKAGLEEEIYKLGDRTVYKKAPNTLARADLNVSDVEKITHSSTKQHLRLHHHPFTKHCNIKPFPNDASALNIAGQLVKISRLKVR